MFFKELEDAIYRYDVDSFNKVLQECQEGISDNELNKLFQIACQKGAEDIVSSLLSNPRVNPASLDFEAVEWAINPSITSNFPLQLAVVNGQIGVIKLLLADSRVTPAGCGDYRPLELAAQYDQSEIVKLFHKYFSDNKINYEDDISWNLWNSVSSILSKKTRPSWN